MACYFNVSTMALVSMSETPSKHCEIVHMELEFTTFLLCDILLMRNESFDINKKHQEWSESHFYRYSNIFIGKRLYIDNNESWFLCFPLGNRNLVLMHDINFSRDGKTPAFLASSIRFSLQLHIEQIFDWNLMSLTKYNRQCKLFWAWKFHSFFNESDRCD